MDGWQVQSMPRAKERSFSSPWESEETLRSTIHNLRSIILKHEATIERLQRQLAEEKVASLQRIGG